MSESIHPSLPAAPIEQAISLPAPKAASGVPIQQVSWEGSRSPSPQNFELMEQHMKALGATYYRLEKWGNRGELFRFSCFVTPLEPHSYEKHFQAIGADAVTVMRSVITDIEAWKNATRE
jgi:negative regulator of sigma E activity